MCSGAHATAVVEKPTFRAEWYGPAPAAAGQDPGVVMLYAHGGAYVSGNAGPTDRLTSGCKCCVPGSSECLFGLLFFLLFFFLFFCFCFCFCFFVFVFVLSFLFFCFWCVGLLHAVRTHRRSGGARVQRTD